MQNKLSLGREPLPSLRKRAFLIFVLYYNTEQPTSARQAGIRGATYARAAPTFPAQNTPAPTNPSSLFPNTRSHPPPPFQSQSFFLALAVNLKERASASSNSDPSSPAPPTPQRVSSVLGAPPRPVSKTLADAAFGASPSLRSATPALPLPPARGPFGGFPPSVYCQPCDFGELLFPAGVSRAVSRVELAERKPGGSRFKMRGREGGRGLGGEREQEP